MMEAGSIHRLSLAHATAAGGDALIAISLAGTLFFDVPTGEARTRVALYLLLTMAPFSLLAPLIGPRMDRARGGHRLAIVLAAIGRAALALLMATSSDTLLLYPAAFGVLVLSRAHAVGRSALLPRIVEREDQLVSANAALVRTAVLGGLILAAPGLLIQRVFGSGPTLILAGAIYGLAATAAVAIPRPRRRAGTRITDGSSIPLQVQKAMKVNAVIRGAGGFLLILLAFGLRSRGVGGAGFGLVLAASGLGSFIGASIVPRLRRGSNELWVLAVSLLAGAGTSLIAAGSFDTDLAALVGGTVGMMTNSGRLALDSLTQRSVPDERRGRVFARIETLMQLSWVVGALIPALIPIAVAPGLVAASAAFLGAAAWYLVTLGPEGRRSLSH